MENDFLVLLDGLGDRVDVGCVLGFYGAFGQAYYVEKHAELFAN